AGAACLCVGAHRVCVRALAADDGDERPRVPVLLAPQDVECALGGVALSPASSSASPAAFSSPSPGADADAPATLTLHTPCADAVLHVRRDRVVSAFAAPPSDPLHWFGALSASMRALRL